MLPISAKVETNICASDVSLEISCMHLRELPEMPGYLAVAGAVVPGTAPSRQVLEKEVIKFLRIRRPERAYDQACDEKQSLFAMGRLSLLNKMTQAPS